jgi:hypothetical protein
MNSRSNKFLYYVGSVVAVLLVCKTIDYLLTPLSTPRWAHVCTFVLFLLGIAAQERIGRHLWKPKGDAPPESEL